jgi:hypothetical protein
MVLESQLRDVDVVRAQFLTARLALRAKIYSLPRNQPLAYKFALPNVNHTFQPVRNPQTFVPNIFFAKPADYTKATQRIWHRPYRAAQTRQFVRV